MTIGRVPLVLLMAAWLCSWPSASQGAAQQTATPAATAPASDEAEHEALRQMKAFYEAAIRDNKIDVMAPYFSDDFYGVMLTGRIVKSFDDVKKYWADVHALMGEGGSYTTTLNPERSVIVGDVALARGTSSDVVVTAEKREYRFTSMWTAVLRKQDGQWKLTQVQGTIDPIDNPFVREFNRRYFWVATPFSALGGLVIGLAFAWVLRRRSRQT
jgi:ketosteroid isomerase-like protein